MASPNELSFLPDDYLERKAQRRTNAICAILFLIVMVAIGTTFTVKERSMRDVEKEYEQVEKDYTEAAKRIELVQQLQDKQRRMTQQAELAASLLEKVPRSNLLADLTNALPPGVSLLDLAMESRPRSTTPPGGAPAKSAFDQQKKASDAKKADAPGSPIAPKLYDVSLKVSGTASTDIQVAQFIGKLNQSTLLTDVNLIVSEEYKDKDDEQQSHMRKFQIEAKLDPNAEVTPNGNSKNSSTAAVEIKEH